MATSSVKNKKLWRRECFLYMGKTSSSEKMRKGNGGLKKKSFYTTHASKTHGIWLFICVKYEQRSAIFLITFLRFFGPIHSVKVCQDLHFSSHHWFSLRTCNTHISWWARAHYITRHRIKWALVFTWASSSSVKSFLILNVFLISSGVLPLIMFATVLQVTSSKPLMSK